VCVIIKCTQNIKNYENFYCSRPPNMGMDAEELMVKTFENVPHVMAARIV